MLRAQLPVWSPLSGRSLAAGLGRALRSDPLGALERVLAAEYDARQVRLTESGTSALTLALRALGPHPVVALPAYGCFDLVTAAVGADATVRFYDLDPATLAPDEASLERALVAGVQAVVFVHLYGIPVDLAGWTGRIRAAGAVSIDDAAQAAGARIGGRPAGALGDLGVLSFGRGKGRTGGHGGALLATSEQGLELAASLRDELQPMARVHEAIAVGKLFAQWVLGRPQLYGIPLAIPGMTLGETRYHPPRLPRRMGRTAAGVLLAGAGAYREAITARRAMAERVRTRLATISDAGIIRLSPDAMPGWLRFPVVLSDRRIAAARSKAGRAAGMMSGYPQTLPSLPALEGRVAGGLDAWAGARDLVRGLITLPTHRWVSTGDLDRIAAILEGTADVRRQG